MSRISACSWNVFLFDLSDVKNLLKKLPCSIGRNSIFLDLWNIGFQIENPSKNCFVQSLTKSNYGNFMASVLAICPNIYWIRTLDEKNLVLRGKNGKFSIFFDSVQFSKKKTLENLYFKSFIFNFLEPIFDQ